MLNEPTQRKGYRGLKFWQTKFAFFVDPKIQMKRPNWHYKTTVPPKPEAFINVS